MQDYVIPLTLEKCESLVTAIAEVLCLPDGATCKNLENILNRHSVENASNTPDFILAKYLMECMALEYSVPCASFRTFHHSREAAVFLVEHLRNFHDAVNARERWYNRLVDVKDSNFLDFPAGDAQSAPIPTGETTVTTKLQPLGDRVLVRRTENTRQTPGGLFIPPNAQEKSTQGVVVSVGPGRRDDHGNTVGMDVTVGDVILFGKYAGSDVVVEGEDYVIVREDDIVGVFRG